MQAAQKKQATAADTVVEKHDCAHNPKGKECPVHGMDACPAKEMSEEASDAMKDRRMERGGVAGNQRYDRPAKGVKTGPMSDAEKKKSREASSRAMDFVRASITSKYGKGAIIDTKKK